MLSKCVIATGINGSLSNVPHGDTSLFAAEGVPGDTSPSLASQQLALSIAELYGALMPGGQGPAQPVPQGRRSRSRRDVAGALDGLFRAGRRPLWRRGG